MSKSLSADTTTVRASRQRDELDVPVASTQSDTSLTASDRVSTRSESVAIPESKTAVSTQHETSSRPVTSPARLSRSSESVMSAVSSTTSHPPHSHRKNSGASRATLDRANTSSSSIHEFGIDVGVGLPSIGQIQVQEPPMDIAQIKAAKAMEDSTVHEDAASDITEGQPVVSAIAPASAKKSAPMRRDRLSMGMSLPFMRNRVVSDQDVLFDAPRPTTVPSQLHQSINAEDTKTGEDPEKSDFGASNDSRHVAELSIPSLDIDDQDIEHQTSVGDHDESLEASTEVPDILSESLSYGRPGSHAGESYEAMSPVIMRDTHAKPEGHANMSLLELSSFVDQLNPQHDYEEEAPMSDERPEEPETIEQADAEPVEEELTSTTTKPAAKFPDASAKQQAFYSSSATYKCPVSSHSSSPATPSMNKNITIRKKEVKQSREAGKEASRPSTADSAADRTTASELKPTNDISFSFEPSFIGTEIESRPGTMEAKQMPRLDAVREAGSTQTPVQQRIAALQARHAQSSSPAPSKTDMGPESRLQMHRRPLSGVSDLSDDGTPGPVRKSGAMAHHLVDESNAYRSPAPNSSADSKAQAHRWETPAATKKYANEAPTDTAIAKRVEKFQIPAEQLQALQPSIEALRSETLMDRQTADRLTVKESSARIDSLQKENFGLKLKVMFLERHFSGEVDQDKTALRNESVRLGTIATDLVNKNRALERALKQATEQVSALELEKAKGNFALVKANGSTDTDTDTQQKLLAAEAHIDRLEAEEDAEIHDLKEDLADAREHVEALKTEVDTLRAHLDADERSQTSRSRGIASGEALRHRCLDLEDALDSMEQRHQRQMAFMEEELADKSDLLAECREKLEIAIEDLQQYDAQLEDADRLREAAVADVRTLYETERREYEMYIEDRHAEIDDLKQQMRSHNQDSYDARLADAVKPHEDAWRELSAQCSALEMALRDKQRIYDEDRFRLESDLAEATQRERDALEEGDELADELARLQEAHHALQGKYAEVDHELALRSTAASLPSALLNEELDALRTTVAALEKERQDLRMAQHTLENKVQETGDKNGALEVELESRRELLRNLQQDLEEARRRVPELQKQLADTRERFTALDIKCQAYETDLAEAHAAHDDATRDAELLRRQLMHGAQADANAEEANQALLKDLEKANAQWQDAQKDARQARAELAQLRRALQEFDGFTADGSVAEIVNAVFANQRAESGRLMQEVARLREAKETDAYARASQARSTEKAEKELAAVQRQAELSKANAEKAEQALRQREKELDNLNKAMRTQFDGQAKQQQSNDQQMKARDTLLEAMLSKLASVLEADQCQVPPATAEAPKPAQNFTKFKEGLFAAIQSLQQQKQLARGDHRQAESDARRKCARLEAQLREQSAALAKTEAKIQDMNLSLLEAKQQTEKLKADNDDMKGKRVRTATASRGNPSGTGADSVVASVTSHYPTSTMTEGSRTEMETVAILRLRLEAMAKELKRVQESKHEEHSADKKRLAEQKRENRQLREQIQLRLENGSTRPSSSMSESLKYIGL
ncbi:hypothetical protein BCR37DRAFT_394813 [Protomyces lactucae-debilis]|uniref:Centrosomin N-terminal motif 1 domain-containing protein n=1 Tax=Protomyces lactucae-debilis TaxID=2754530 RepID=A0A1Y2F1F6_PROLT|nr:uncharacterized protein BCR37DRAFT_394813 [Protomyces lactucae-debilis]ORY77721.1 hypothetical protein BCR37DRAFT_394813 [Protomyces lactucae-debilis]